MLRCPKCRCPATEVDFFAQVVHLVDGWDELESTPTDMWTDVMSLVDEYKEQEHLTLRKQVEEAVK